ncbi:MAG: 3'(2'),5'-bisphosphate nucleotidase CysQ [Nitrospirota bacterium]
MNRDILPIVAIAQQTGEAVMAIYRQDEYAESYKEDHSPITRADMISHHIITKLLRKLFRDLPVLSEESKTISYEERKSWRRYWLIDPLDGTKEFIKRNGEFTVNIALIEHGMPVLGVVRAPALGVTYYAARGKGAFKKEVDGNVRKIRVSDYKKNKLKIVASRSHKGEKLEGFLERLSLKMGAYELVSMGSSLKFCLVAEGIAHIYPRLGPTMEWDTAAAQCVVEEAGGMVVDMKGTPLLYNKETLFNEDFIALSSNELLGCIQPEASDK